MDNFVVSARKYRPSTFSSVVGQKSLTDTLKNAIISNRLAHAYLFCGPRGVGKTTCARIFAKTINCMNPRADHEACNECESCKAFNEQRSMNIHELDAASNNSVDDIRNLIAQVRIPPQIGKYSVFIIDEVHMLSPSAFNAFLKTLEEPPAHAIFILATTEKHKILPTILSRCQIYDFSRITLRDIIDHLQYVASSEGITVDTQALEIIAQKADGGMRDALSIFDQLVSYSGKVITYQSAVDSLNVLDITYYFHLVDYALSGDVGQALLLFDDILSRGFDAANFMTGLGNHLRNLLVSKDKSTLRLLESSEKTMAQYEQQAAKCHPKFLFAAINIVADSTQQYRQTTNKRLCAEIMLIRLCQIMAGGNDVQPRTKLSSVTATAPQASNPNSQTTSQSRVQQTSAQLPQQQTNSTLQHQPTSAEQHSHGSSELGSANIKSIQVNVGEPQTQAPSKISIVAPPNLNIVKPEDSGGQKKTEDINQPTQHQSYGNRAYTEQMIVDIWKQFHTEINDQRLSGIFLKLKPQQSEDNPDTWYVNLYNNLQKQLIESYIPRINEHIRKKISNDNFVLSVKVAEQDNDLTYKPYMPQERLQKMVTENPHLKTLIEKFNLKIA